LELLNPFNELLWMVAMNLISNYLNSH